jgi:very-short-patch-repair endonuclease
MVGEKQSDLISDMLRNRLPPAVYDQRRILCGNPAQFQGDERDIIFLSLVDSKDDGAGPLSLKQDGADGMYKKRFNVASSRAKDQLWVVYSLDAQTQLKPNDIRRRLIEHAVDPSSLMNQLNAGLVKTESPFEAEVFKILSGYGYRVTPQWQVGAYRIDMVAEGNGKRLAIECDGERWHYDKAEEDLARQALLERLGWTFVRIRGSVFYRDKTLGRQVALRPLMQRLKEIGIDPFNETTSSDFASKTQTLADEVIQKAAEIRVRTLQPLGASILISDEVETVEQSAVAPIVYVPDKTNELVTPAVQTTTSVELVQTPLSEAPSIDPKPVTASTSLSRPEVFYEGARVRHEKFGLGTVISIKQYGGAISELDIGFDALSEIRTLHPSSVKLRN